MNNPAFSFDLKVLDLDEIENKICEHLKLTGDNYSDLEPFALSEGDSSLRMRVKDNRISCKLHIGKKSDTGLYTVKADSIEVEPMPFNVYFKA
ncbi:MAG: hypothetical protein NC120_03165 [Ruminococcus sp.]|nr:hypothetical protein [Ruminococcus sp.]